MEIIDLTNSPPSTPKRANPHAKRTTPSSANNTQLRPRPPVVRKLSMSDVTSQPAPPPLVHRQNVPGQLIGPDGEPVILPQLPEFPEIMYEPGIGSQARKKYCIYYVGTRLAKDHWTDKEHELFLMGMIRYGKGNWAKIAEEFVTTKTTQQVSRYALAFFKRFPTTCLYAFNYKKPSQLPTITPAMDSNQRQTNPPLVIGSSSKAPTSSVMAAPSGSQASASIIVPNLAVKPVTPPVMTEPPAPGPTTSLTLFPVERPLFPVSPEKSAGEELPPETMGINCTLLPVCGGYQPQSGADDDGDDDNQGLDLNLALGSI